MGWILAFRFGVSPLEGRFEPSLAGTERRRDRVGVVVVVDVSPLGSRFISLAGTDRLLDRVGVVIGVPLAVARFDSLGVGVAAPSFGLDELIEWRRLLFSRHGGDRGDAAAEF
jgi:hypothetical protein